MKRKGPKTTLRDSTPKIFLVCHLVLFYNLSPYLYNTGERSKNVITSLPQNDFSKQSCIEFIFLKDCKKMQRFYLGMRLGVCEKDWMEGVVFFSKDSSV